MAFRYVRNHRVDGSTIPHIALMAFRRAALPGDGIAHDIGFGGRPVRYQRDDRPARAQHLRRRSPDARSAAGDDSDPPGHGFRFRHILSFVLLSLPE
jgi:hypothetical protein